MSATEYLWLEERVKITETVHRGRTEWGTWPGKCLFHKSDVEESMKEFIKSMQGPILPTEEKLISRLEDVLCCCGNRPNQKTVVARSYGYTAGVNLPEYAHEDRQSHLIEYFHNLFNSLSSEKEEDASAETDVDFRMKIVKFLDEVLQSHRYRVYNPGVVRFLHIIKQYLEKPFVDYIELPLVNFIRLIEGPLWEECAEKLRTRFCSDIYVDFNSDVIDAGNIGIYLEGPSVLELKGVKNSFTTFIDKTINPPKEEDKKEPTDDKSEAKESQEKKTTEGDEKKRDNTEGEKENGQAADDNHPGNTQKIEGKDEKTEVTSESSSIENKSDSSNEQTTDANDKKRDSRSMDRSLNPSTTVNEKKEAFMRSKSVPASSTTEVQESHTQSAKRAKYDSECSSGDILTPNPMQELTLFKETLSLVLVNRIEDNSTSLVNVQ